MRFLLVDDDPISILIMTKILERLEVATEILTAPSGKAALDLLDKQYHNALAMPDIIFVDLNMPLMNGFQFIEAFQELDILGKRGIRIIIVTSSDDPEDKEKARELGVKDFLTKPVITETVLDAIL
jgi:CheY-like chemotaxis protein